MSFFKRLIGVSDDHYGEVVTRVSDHTWVSTSGEVINQVSDRVGLSSSGTVYTRTGGGHVVGSDGSLFTGFGDPTCDGAELRAGGLTSHSHSSPDNGSDW